MGSSGPATSRSPVWSPCLEPGRLALVHGAQQDLVGFFQELTHFSVHRGPGAVLWCDGNHCFNPYDLAELNLTRGSPAGFGAKRVLVKRCMTPFQWDSVLHGHLEQKLVEAETALVVVNPFDQLWSHEEIQDWEQEDYMRFSVRHLQGVARRRKVPILLGVDLARLWRSHPALAQIVRGGADVRWAVGCPDKRWKAVREDGLVLDPHLRRQVTLLDYAEEELVVSVPSSRRTRTPAWSS